MYQPSEYRATSTLVVLPKAAGAEVASYYDTLSQGQIATTFAQILALQGSRTAPEGGADAATVAVEVVPDTSLIQVTATTPRAATAEAAADDVLTRVSPYFDELNSPYDVSVVRPATGTAQRTGLALGTLAGVVVGVAVISGLAAYLASGALAGARQLTHPGSPALRARPANGADTASVGSPNGRQLGATHATNGHGGHDLASSGVSRDAAAPIDPLPSQRAR